jgi:hypothetical protein
LFYFTNPGVGIIRKTVRTLRLCPHNQRILPPRSLASLRSKFSTARHTACRQPLLQSSRVCSSRHSIYPASVPRVSRLPRRRVRPRNHDPAPAHMRLLALNCGSLLDPARRRPFPESTLYLLYQHNRYCFRYCFSIPQRHMPIVLS